MQGERKMRLRQVGLWRETKSAHRAGVFDRRAREPVVVMRMCFFVHPIKILKLVYDAPPCVLTCIDRALCVFDSPRHLAGRGAARVVFGRCCTTGRQ